MTTLLTPAPEADVLGSSEQRPPSSSGPTFHRGRDWIRSLLALLVLLGITAVVSAVLWPGLMNLNTLSDYRQARQADFWDWDSAIWVAIWRGLYVVGLRSPGWLFAGVVLLLLAGLYLILRARLSRPWALAGAALVFVFPPVLSFSVVIGTGAWFLASIVCAFGFAARCARTEGTDRTVSAVLAVAFAFLAEAARPTAAPAVFALLLALAFVMLEVLSSWRRMVAAAAVGVVGTILLAGTVVGVERFVLHARVSHPEQVTYEYDLVALSIREHQVMLPADVYGRQDPDYLQQFAASYGGFLNIDPLLYGYRAAITPPPLTDETVDGLQRAWLTSIDQHPYAYLQDRLHTALWQLGILGPELTVYYDAPSPKLFGPGPFPGPKNAVVAYTTLGTTDGNGGPLQAVWLYVVVLLFFTVFGLRGARRTDVVLVLFSVGMLLFSAGVLFASPAVTYRYMHPAVTTGTVLFVLLAAAGMEWLWYRVSHSVPPLLQSARGR